MLFKPKDLYLKRRGFTLIELLVVIAIIGLLSSVVLASLSGARERARDARRKQDLNQLRTAISLYYEENNEMPANYDPGWGACTDGIEVNGRDNADAFYQTMQDLVDGGFMTAIPDADGDLGYCYYDYGRNHPAGAIVVSYLEAMEPTTEAPVGTCRPFTNNWCSHTIAQPHYCVCSEY